MSAEKIPETKIIREVSMQAEDFYKEAVQLGDHAAHALQSSKRSERSAHRSQMTGLENVAESTLKVSDVLDYIKRQTGRREEWRRGFPGKGGSDEWFGLRLKKYLENNLAERRNKICERLNIADQIDEDKHQRRHIHLLLIRQFLRQMVIQYEFRSGFDDNEKEP